LRKLGVDVVVRGEREEVVAELARRDDWGAVPHTAHFYEGTLVGDGGVHASSFVDHPPLSWPSDWIAAHLH
ncbi:MAG: B12-binding domain-containing radical SAM protein, partial [Mesorhizobium sp.]